MMRRTLENVDLFLRGLVITNFLYADVLSPNGSPRIDHPVHTGVKERGQARRRGRDDIIAITRQRADFRESGTLVPTWIMVMRNNQGTSGPSCGGRGSLPLS